MTKRLRFILALSPALVGCATGSGQSVPGLADGKLLQCPSSPNCICSEYPGDTAHFTEPVKVPVAKDLGQTIKTTVEAMGGRLEAEEENYLAFTFTSRVFRFVDDFEVRLNASEGLLHIRSASRVGHSDLGVNRKRVDRFKEELRQRLQDSTR